MHTHALAHAHALVCPQNTGMSTEHWYGYTFSGFACVCVGVGVGVGVCVCVSGGALGRYVQRKLSGVKIFEEQYVSMQENLRMAITICDQWVTACEHLTGQVWLPSDSSLPL